MLNKDNVAFSASFKMMSKTRSSQRTRYQCTECGAVQNKWSGQCSGCLQWNTMVESLATPDATQRFTGWAGDPSSYHPVPLAGISAETLQRFHTGLEELDRVLGGGVVPGSAILLGGDPGIGKSTLLLQMMDRIQGQGRSLYVTGEESLSQVSMRAQRLGLAVSEVDALAEVSLERILAALKEVRPGLLVVDSIQTLYSEAIQSAPGSVVQVRECASQLVRMAKQTRTAVFFVGHVTKEGSLAGPRVLEHMVDCVLYFEGDSGSRYRIVRSFKNRYGSVNELGVFAMTESGLREVRNPSALFLSRGEEDLPGSAITVIREGSRPLLIEVQALVDESHASAPRRLTVGLDMNRIAMLLAVLSRHGGMPVAGYDVFVNLVGGMRVNETAVDLAVIAAVVSCLRNRPIPRNWILLGEVGLSGEVRPVANGDERLREAVKHGFTYAVVPQRNAPRENYPGLELMKVRTLRDLMALI